MKLASIGLTVGIFLFFFWLMGMIGCSGGITDMPQNCDDDTWLRECDSPTFDCPPKKKCLFDPQTGLWVVEEHNPGYNL